MLCIMLIFIPPYPPFPTGPPSYPSVCVYVYIHKIQVHIWEETSYQEGLQFIHFAIFFQADYPSTLNLLVSK